MARFSTHTVVPRHPDDYGLIPGWVDYKFPVLQTGVVRFFSRILRL